MIVLTLFSRSFLLNIGVLLIAPRDWSGIFSKLVRRVWMSSTRVGVRLVVILPLVTIFSSWLQSTQLLLFSELSIGSVIVDDHTLVAYFEGSLINIPRPTSRLDICIILLSMSWSVGCKNLLLISYSVCAIVGLNWGWVTQWIGRVTGWTRVVCLVNQLGQLRSKFLIIIIFFFKL